MQEDKNKSQSETAIVVSRVVAEEQPAQPTATTTTPMSIPPAISAASTLQVAIMAADTWRLAGAVSGLDGVHFQTALSWLYKGRADKARDLAARLGNPAAAKLLDDLARRWCDQVRAEAA